MQTSDANALLIGPRDLPVLWCCQCMPAHSGLGLHESRHTSVCWAKMTRCQKHDSHQSLLYHAGCSRRGKLAHTAKTGDQERYLCRWEAAWPRQMLGVLSWCWLLQPNRGTEQLPEPRVCTPLFVVHLHGVQWKRRSFECFVCRRLYRLLSAPFSTSGWPSSPHRSWSLRAGAHGAFEAGILPLLKGVRHCTLQCRVDAMLQVSRELTANLSYLRLCSYINGLRRRMRMFE